MDTNQSSLVVGMHPIGSCFAFHGTVVKEIVITGQKGCIFFSGLTEKKVKALLVMLQTSDSARHRCQ